MDNKEYDILSNLSFYERECVKNQDTNIKIEFIDGVITYSCNTSIMHNKIVFRFASKIDDYLENSKCEVLSDGNPENDYERKYKFYRKYGIREYNIIEQNGNIVQFTLQNSFYHVTNTFNKNDIFTSSVFSDLKIDLKQIFR